MEVTSGHHPAGPKSPDPLYAVWSGWAPLIYGTAASGHVVKLVKFPTFRPYTRARVPARLRRKRIEVHQLHPMPAGRSARMRPAATSTPCHAMTRSPGRGAAASKQAAPARAASRRTCWRRGSTIIGLSQREKRLAAVLHRSMAERASTRSTTPDTAICAATACAIFLPLPMLLALAQR